MNQHFLPLTFPLGCLRDLETKKDQEKSILPLFQNALVGIVNFSNIRVELVSIIQGKATICQRPFVLLGNY